MTSEKHLCDSDKYLGSLHGIYMLCDHVTLSYHPK